MSSHVRFAVLCAVVGMVLWVWGVVLWITAENWWGWASMAAGLLLYRESWDIAGDLYARRTGPGR